MRINFKKTPFQKAILLSLLAGLISPCIGQITNHTNTKNKEPLPTILSYTTTVKDPLFFIEGQLCQHVRKIFQDRKGNLWFGTNVYGLMRYDGNTLQYFDNIQGLGAGRITGIVEDAKGNIWFGTSSGLTKYDGNTFVNFTKENGLVDNEIWSLTIDSKEKIWIGTTRGVSIFDGKTFTTFKVPRPYVKNPNPIYFEQRIVSIVEDDAGAIWFGTDGFGICKFDGLSFTNLTSSEGLADNTISEMMFDKKGNLWIGTYFGGLSLYNGKTFINFTKNGIIKGEEVGGFFEDENGDIWFAVENNGIYRFRNGEFTHYYKEEGLETNGILSIYKDKEKRFWFGGWGGLFRYKEKAFVSVTINGPWDKQY